MKRFTPEEDREIIRLHTRERMSAERISRLIGRRRGSVRHRLIRLGVYDRPLPAGEWETDEAQVRRRAAEIAAEKERRAGRQVAPSLMARIGAA